MRKSVTLQFKLNGILTAFLILSLINAAIIFFVVNQQKAAGRAINLAGRQRMLTQKMSKEVFIANTLAKDPKRITELNQKLTALVKPPICLILP